MLKIYLYILFTLSMWLILGILPVRMVTKMIKLCLLLISTFKHIFFSTVAIEKFWYLTLGRPRADPDPALRARVKEGRGRVRVRVGKKVPTLARPGPWTV